MASSRPSSAPRARGGTAAAFGLFAAFLALGILSFGEVFHGVMAGAAAFAVHRQLIVRTWLLSDHNRGVQLAKSQQHAEALAAFRASEATWSRRAWLDRRRAPVLASASRWGFGDQARYNQALCLHALDRPREAHRVLTNLLQVVPEMGVARALLEHIEATHPEEDAAWTELDDALEASPT